ncbi:MAG TPA: hypothetical protein DCQ97_08825 [Chitinophagaceae bacterium]|nr:hypothetical protein [Chitinophagaceae bacterium]
MEKIELLQLINFGERIAEDEVETLDNYFVRTEDWRLLFDNNIDIVYGTKGAGKSALYTILDSKKQELFDKSILLTTAENPRGNTVFENLNIDPPTTEIEFIRLWKLYFLVITVSEFADWDIDSKKFIEIKKILTEAKLIPVQKGLRAILKACRDYIKQVMNLESIEPKMGVDGASGMPTSFSLKVAFREPDNNELDEGMRSIDYLYQTLQEALEEEKFSLWIAVDRLDIAFSENLELETNALRALFKVYRDLTPYSNLRIKIFLRVDIWRRITEQGFREASHITKTTTIGWKKETIVNLIMRRLLNNSIITSEFNINKDAILNDYRKQEEIFYKFFPEQIEIGDKKPKTIDWILSRVKDGAGVVAPREIIHLLNEGKSEQIRRIQIGQNDLENDNLIGRSAFKIALDKVSKVRLEQTIYAEYPSLKKYIQKLSGEKTEQKIETLSSIWGISKEETRSIAQKLINIGFFEERGDKDDPRFWVPFMYRNELEMVQGVADV